MSRILVVEDEQHLAKSDCDSTWKPKAIRWPLWKREKLRSSC